MSGGQTLNSLILLREILDVLLNHAGLYETLRGRAGALPLPPVPRQGLAL